MILDTIANTRLPWMVCPTNRTHMSYSLSTLHLTVAFLSTLHFINISGLLSYLSPWFGLPPRPRPPLPLDEWLKGPSPRLDPLFLGLRPWLLPPCREVENLGYSRRLVIADVNSICYGTLQCEIQKADV